MGENASKTRTTRRRFVRAAGATVGAGMSVTAGSARAAGVRLVEAKPDAGFNYPYLLYVPSGDGLRSDPALLVQPNDTPGGTSDDFDKHLRGARRTMEGFPRALADELGVPALVPVFPRPDSEPVDWTHYTHQLDRDTLTIDGGPLERIDLQLLSMVDDAVGRVEGETGVSVRDEVMLNGFSNSGNFADRFAVLHAERVLSVTAGGLNGMTLLPLEEVDGNSLPYHIGISDVERITGESVDLDALSETNQFLYMGAEDENDTLPYDDAWTSDELRAKARRVYGEDMITDRFPFCQSAYERAGVEAQFRVYEGLGHEYASEREIAEFHRRSLTGEDVTMYNHDLDEGPVGRVETGGRSAADVIYGPAGLAGGVAVLSAVFYYILRDLNR